MDSLRTQLDNHISHLKADRDALETEYYAMDIQGTQSRDIFFSLSGKIRAMRDVIKELERLV